MHEYNVHNRNSSICLICGKKVLTNHIKIHMSSHSEEKIACDICGKVLKSQIHVERHKKRIHIPDSEKLFKCSYPGCERAFVVAQILEGHMNSHLGLKPYQCDFCETRFQNVSNKAAHLKNVHKFSKN